MKAYLPIKSKAKLILYAFLALFILLNLVYFFLNKAPQAWDSSAHINLSMLYALKMLEGRFSELLTLSGYYPPFVHYIGAIVYLITKSSTAVLLLSYLFYFVAVYYLYKLTHLYTKSTKWSVIGVILFSLIPQVAVELRLFQLDLPLTTLITAALYYLEISKNFSYKKPTLLFFVIFSFAMLTKWYAFVFLVVPFLATINLKKITNSKILENIGLGIIFFFLITIPWYFINYSSILSFFGSVSSLGELNDPQGFWTTENFLEYMNLAFAYQITFVGAIIALIGLALNAFKRPTRAFYYVLCLFVPWLIFTLLTNKDVRYIMPLIPFYVLIIVTSFELIKKPLQTAFLGFAIAYLLIAFFIFGFYQGNTLNKVVATSITSPFNKYKWTQDNPSEFAYRSQDWHLEDMYNYIINDLDKYENKDSKVLFAVDYRYFNSISFNLLQIENSTYYQVTSGFGVLDLSLNQANISSKLDEYKYIVTAYNPGETNLRFYEELVKINRFLQTSGATQFDSKASYKLPNGEEVYLFRNIRYRETYESSNDLDIFLFDFEELK